MVDLPHFRRAVIYGVGLLGGSLGLALRRRGIADRVVGLGRSPERLERAKKMGAIDSFETNPASALADADALVVCIPPRQIRECWTTLAPLAPPGMFVTDVGSVKAALAAEALKHFDPSVRFIGSHPMAGSEKSGVEAAKENLFEGSACFITPTEDTPGETLSLAVQFWRALGSRVVVIDPIRHDELLASISHLPHLIAAALVESLYEYGDSTPYLRAVIGNGFRDTTRIAQGPADVWEQIFTENSDALIKSLDSIIERLQSWRNLLSHKDTSPAIMEMLAQAAKHREQLASPAETDSPDQK